jgi:hypothetical protein
MPKTTGLVAEGNLEKRIPFLKGFYRTHSVIKFTLKDINKFLNPVHFRCHCPLCFQFDVRSYLIDYQRHMFYRTRNKRVI